MYNPPDVDNIYKNQAYYYAKALRDLASSIDSSTENNRRFKDALFRAAKILDEVSSLEVNEPTAFYPGSGVLYTLGALVLGQFFIIILLLATLLG